MRKRRGVIFMCSRLRQTPTGWVHSCKTRRLLVLHVLLDLDPGVQPHPNLQPLPVPCASSSFGPQVSTTPFSRFVLPSVGGIWASSSPLPPTDNGCPFLESVWPVSICVSKAPRVQARCTCQLLRHFPPAALPRFHLNWWLFSSVCLASPVIFRSAHSSTAPVFVRNVMIENIDKVLERGDRLELLVDKIATMQGNTFRFRKQTRRFQNTVWWRNVKLTSINWT